MRYESVNEFGERVIRVTSERQNELTPDQRKMIREAAEKPYEYDEDCPPLDDDMLAELDRRMMVRV